jgi:hypothetical protein
MKDPAVHVCDDAIKDTDLDFLCQVKRHLIQNFGQRNKHPNLLSHGDGALRRTITDAITTARNDWALRTGTEWRGDNALLEKAWLTKGPDWLRELLAIPRCTNCASLYMFLFIDFVLWLIAIKCIRWLLQWAVPPRREDEKDDEHAARTGWMTVVDNRRALIEQGLSAVVAMVAVTLVFRALVRWKPYFEEPHMILGFTITAYLAASTFGDTFVPDLPHPSR